LKFKHVFELTLADQHDLLALIKGCRRKDRSSQKLLYQRFYSMGMGICCRYSPSRDEAKEILNDGFLKVFTHIKAYDTDRPFVSWFSKILVNTAINHYRKNLKFQLHQDLTMAKSIQNEESIISGIAYQEVLEMIQELPATYRMVFNLYVMEGYKHREIAQQLGITVGTSKSNLSRAREHLRRILKDYFQEENNVKKETR
jgi:RNA polymerase sigma factor (sigma-70 family)